MDEVIKIGKCVNGCTLVVLRHAYNDAVSIYIHSDLDTDRTSSDIVPNLRDES